MPLWLLYRGTSVFDARSSTVIYVCWRWCPHARGDNNNFFFFWNLHQNKNTKRKTLRATLLITSEWTDTYTWSMCFWRLLCVCCRIGRMHLSRLYRCRPWREWTPCPASAVGGQSGWVYLATLLRPALAIGNSEPGAFPALAHYRTMRVVLARPYLGRAAWSLKKFHPSPLELRKITNLFESLRYRFYCTTVGALTETNSQNSSTPEYQLDRPSSLNVGTVWQQFFVTRRSNYDVIFFVCHEKYPRFAVEKTWRQRGENETKYLDNRRYIRVIRHNE